MSPVEEEANGTPTSAPARARAPRGPGAIPRTGIRGTGLPGGRIGTGVTGGIFTSLVVHALLALAILGAAWGVATVSRRDEPPVVLTADFSEPAPSAPADLSTDFPPPEAPSDAAPPRSDTDLSARLRALERDAPADGALDALSRRFEALAPAAPPARDEDPAPRAGASFGGLVSGNAVDVAYVVDASGSMVGTFPKIVDEVERSLARLSADQRFALLVFRRDGAEAFDGAGALVPASRAERARAVEWLRREVIPAGRSSPIEALSRALAAGADCVFLLSSTRTGPGRHDLDRETTLALLERLNPPDPATGVRRATIQCIQFLDEDPGGTLAAVADRHFGPGGYRFIPRSAVGLSDEGPFDSSEGAQGEIDREVDRERDAPEPAGDDRRPALGLGDANHTRRGGQRLTSPLSRLRTGSR